MRSKHGFGWIKWFLVVALLSHHHPMIVDAMQCSSAFPTASLNRHSSLRISREQLFTTCTSSDIAVDPFFTEIDQYEGDLPDQLAYPFWYQPHPVAVWAANHLREQLQQESHWMMHDFGLNDKNAVTMGGKHNQKEAVGKMFGVLVVQRTTPPQKHDEKSNGTADTNKDNFKLGYLKAFSGTLQSATTPPGFCPMVYDRLDAKGFFKQGEAQLNAINREVDELEQCPERAARKAHLESTKEESQQKLTDARQHQKAQKEKRRLQREEMKQTCTTQEYQVLEEQLLQQGAAIQRQLKALKAQVEEDIALAQQSVDEIENRIDKLKQRRKTQSANLQNQLFEQYQFWNCRGDTKSLLPIFADTPLQRPPGGAGDCAAPKLFQYAFQKGYHPIALAEFWWGKSPALEVRNHNFYYPACRGKCQPILEHMLHGLNVEENPLEQPATTSSGTGEDKGLEILYEDDYMVVVNKPPEMLSVPGRHVEQSVYTEMKQRNPHATGPLLVHRLDMSTSGILVVAKDKDIHKQIQAQFIDRSIKKRYTALLEGECDITNTSGMPPKGKIDLPLSLDYLNRPMQKVDFDKKTGKPAVTFYEIVEVKEGRTRIQFYPVTGRTHQLRVHAAHAMGLNIPIVGDDIYGQREERLCLHAGFLEMTHPVTQKRITFVAEVPF